MKGLPGVKLPDSLKDEKSRLAPAFFNWSRCLLLRFRSGSSSRGSSSRGSGSFRSGGRSGSFRSGGSFSGFFTASGQGKSKQGGSKSREFHLIFLGR